MEKLENLRIRNIEREYAVARLNANQHRPDELHPYTCGNNSKHRPLIACYGGWWCADCGYEQDYHSEIPANVR